MPRPALFARCAVVPRLRRAATIIRDRTGPRAAATLLAGVLAGPLAAAPLGVATWNLQWLQDADAHAQWVAACSRNGWPRDTARLPADERAALAGLPYCDVHNGMVFPPDRCKSAQGDWPNAARYPAAHPCRATADLAAPAQYAEKIAALRAMFGRLDAAGVGLVAVQEAGSAAAVRAILPPGWSVATTRELAGTPKIAQHVGVAWKRGVAVREIAAVNALADSGMPERPLRPGLAFTVDVGGRPVRALVVHLKAGCRNRDLDAPLTGKDLARMTAERSDAVASDCALLRYQVPALEGWIDGNAARDFAVLGDFNRTLLREPVADSDAWRTRVDGGSAASPVGPCTLRRDGARVTAQCPAQTRALFPEINDNDPPGAVLWRARYEATEGTAPRRGECRIAGPHGVVTHSGIDHVLISESLKRRLTPAALVLRVENYVEADGSPLRAGPDRALPSDHCPHVVVWTPRS